MRIFRIREKPSSNNLYYVLALAVIFGIALFIRTYFPYEHIFTGDWIRFHWTDPWYHMRLVDNLVQHFPHRIYFDPYTFYPHGHDVDFAPFPDLLYGFFAWLFGAGSPSTKVTETVCAYFPAILGALVTIPIYFIGKELFNKKAGLIAAALIAVLPGEFLSRTLLGNTDHHAAEILFSTLTMLFLILALKSAKQNEISFSSVRLRDLATLKKPFIYSLLAGVSLGLYLLSWIAGCFLILVILAFALIQYLADHLRGRSTEYLCIIIVPSFVIALVLVIPFLWQFGVSAQSTPASFIKIDMLFLCIGIAGFPVMSMISRFMSSRNLKRAYYPLALAAMFGIFLGFFYLINSSAVDRLIENSYNFVFNPPSISPTVSEWRPLWSSSLTSEVWENFTTSFYLFLISLVFIAYAVIKKGAADRTLLLVWSTAILIATFLQIRFTYYFAVNASLLTAYLCWQILTLAVTTKSPQVGQEKMADRKRKSKPSKDVMSKRYLSLPIRLRTLAKRHPANRFAFGVLAAVGIFFLAFYPNIGYAIKVANEAMEPSQDWHDALVWLKENTPDPFNNPDFYYEIYERPAVGEDYNYPESAYSVMSWWDYGHWITYIAHRIPVANPNLRGFKEAALFFTAQNEAEGSQILDELDTRYVIIEQRTALHIVPDAPVPGPHGYFAIMVDLAGKNRSEYFEIYYVSNEEGRLVPVLLYYPAYYQSMSSRLYLFGGKKVVPVESTLVISYIERMDTKGTTYKEIDELQRFATYEEATAFLELHGSSNYTRAS